MKTLTGKRGQALVGGAVVVVTVIILLFISILLVSKVRGSVDRDSATTSFTAEDNTTFNEVVSNANTAFTLLAIALIVLVAGLIIAILRGGL